MKKIITLFLTACLLLALCSCGIASSSPASSGPATSQGTEQESVPIELAEEEYVFHGVHMQIPDVYEMVVNEDNEHQVTSQWKDIDTAGQNQGFISFYDEEETYWDVSLGGEEASYSPDSSRIYYSDYNFSGRIDDDGTLERRRINNIDALIWRRPDPAAPGTVRNRVYLVLESCVVTIDLTSYNEQFEDLFSQCIETIRVDDDEIPEIVQMTSPETLAEQGLSTKAWEYHGIYIHVPASYTLLETADGSFVWISEDGQSFLMMREGTADLLMLDEDELKIALNNSIPGAVEIPYCWTGSYHGMFASSAGIKTQEEGQERMVDFSIFLTEIYGFVSADGIKDEHTLLVYASWPADDAAAEELLNNSWYTIHFADDWVGDGLLDVEPIPQSEWSSQQGG